MKKPKFDMLHKVAREVQPNSTIATAPLSPENKERMEVGRLDKEKAIIILGGWLEAYQKGELTFEKLCRYSQKALRKFSDPFRHKLLGKIIDEALNSPQPPKRGKGNRGEPSWVRGTSKELVDMVKEREGLLVNRASSKREGESAFSRVVEIWEEAGVYHITASRIEKWYYTSNTNRKTSDAT